MFAFYVLLMAALCADEVISNDAVPQGSSMIRREDVGGHFEVSASGSFPKHRVNLRQSAERRPVEFAESSGVQPSRVLHEEEATLPIDTVEVVPDHPDESAAIKKLEDEVAALKMRLGADNRAESHVQRENRMKKKRKSRARSEDEDFHGQKDIIHSRDPEKADEQAARSEDEDMHAQGDNTYAYDPQSSEQQAAYESPPYRNRAPQTFQNHRRLPRAERKRSRRSHNEALESADVVDTDDDYGVADSLEHRRDFEWIVKPKDPLRRLAQSSKSDQQQHHHRRKRDGEFFPNERHIKEFPHHGDNGGSEYAIRDGIRAEGAHVADESTDGLSTSVSTTLGSTETMSTNIIGAEENHNRFSTSEGAISDSNQHMSADEQNAIAQKIVGASRNSAHALANANVSATPHLKSESTPTRSPSVSVSKAPIEFEPWRGTTNPPEFDPFGQNEYLQAPQMLATAALDDSGAATAAAAAAAPLGNGDEAGGADLARSLTGMEDAPPVEHEAGSSTEGDGTNQYGLSYPPKNRPQLEQYLRIAREMERVELMGGVSEQGARSAFKNLYVNWTHTDYNVQERYLSGMRIRIVGQQIFYTPEPPELRQLAITQPSAFERMFSIVAAHVLSFLTGTMARFKLPNADFTMAFGDFCVGTTRLFHDAWGTKKHVDADVSENPEGVPNAEFTEAFQVPVFQWTNTQSGRKACNVITTSTYDWNWWGSNFTEGNSWRLDRVPPAWKQRLNKMVWRGSLLSQEDIRSRAIRVGLRHPDWFDVKGVKALDCEKFVADLAAFTDHNSISDCQASLSNFTPMEEQQKYKYILEMDGGGTTFRFKNVLLGGFLVFKVDSDTTQFWSDSLQPFVHYIPVSKENFEQDLVRKLHWAMEHDTDCEHIAANARRFAQEYLQDADAHWQQQAAISIYAGRQNFIPVGPEPGMMRFCCRDAANVNLKTGVKLTGLASECIDHDPACATSVAPNEMLYSVPRLQDIMRASTLEEVAQDINTTKEVILNVHSAAKDANPAPPISNMQIWKDFADMLQPFTLVEGHVMQDSSLAAMMQSYASRSEVKTICEVGFNAGHSALLLLLSNPSAHVYSFDISRYSYTKAAVEFVSAHFPKRFTFVEGDSSQSLPAFRTERAGVKCDLAIVDGAHIAPWPEKDILNFWHLASGPESTIIMMDTSCEISWCSGPSAAWKAMTRAGIITELSNTKIDKTHSFSVGVFQKAPDAEALQANAIDWPGASQTLSVPPAGQETTPVMPQSNSTGISILPSMQSQTSEASMEDPAISIGGGE